MNVVALLQCVLAATSFAEATVVKKNAKSAKELGWALPRPSTRFPRAAEFPIDCKRNFMV